MAEDGRQYLDMAERAEIASAAEKAAEAEHFFAWPVCVGMAAGLLVGEYFFPTLSTGLCTALGMSLGVAVGAVLPHLLK